jgi:hypothetical protein
MKRDAQQHAEPERPKALLLGTLLAPLVGARLAAALDVIEVVGLETKWSECVVCDEMIM